MFKWAILGLLAAAFLTIFLTGPISTWVGPWGPIPVLIVALVFRLVVLAVLVWLAVWVMQRDRQRAPRL